MARVLVEGSRPLLRFGLAALLARAPFVTACREAAGPAEALALLEAGPADLLVLAGDDLDEGDRYDWLAGIRRRWSRMPVLAWLPVAAPRPVGELYRLGVRGMVTGDMSLAAITGAATRLIEGRSAYADEVRPYLPPEARARSGPLPPLPPEPAGPDPSAVACLLSERQREILGLAGIGMRPRRIALQLGISTRTVYAHREQMKLRLGLPTTDALDALAVRWVVRAGRR